MKDFFCLSLIFWVTTSGFAQTSDTVQKVRPDERYDSISLNRQEPPPVFKVPLTKDRVYTILVQQQGIDVVVRLLSADGQEIREEDSPTGMDGLERFQFSPDSSATYRLQVSALEDEYNSSAGTFSLEVKATPDTLSQISRDKLLQDLAILENAYVETQVGLWYNSRQQLDSVFAVAENKVRDGMTSLEFYRLVAPLVAFTKEGHSYVKISDEVSAYLDEYGRYLPLLTRVIDKKVYLVNDIDGQRTAGLRVSRINDTPVDSILNFFLHIEPPDGYNTTGPYRWIEGQFAPYYLRFFNNQPVNTLTLYDEQQDSKLTLDSVPGINIKAYQALRTAYQDSVPALSRSPQPAQLAIKEDQKTAILIFERFLYSQYEAAGMNFKTFVDSAFQEIFAADVKSLIIDIRKNGGGNQGAEDYLLSYLSDSVYTKYQYAELPEVDYSFFEHTDRADPESSQAFSEHLTQEFYQAYDGRWLAKDSTYVTAPPQPRTFRGNLYILTGGRFFSGSSEFAALAKNYTNAMFIGEETGGGYYGNTSGKYLMLTLPHSGLLIRVPLIKFVVNIGDTNVPYGHGVLPDHPVQPTIHEFLRGYDAELEFAKKLIRKHETGERPHNP